jgi:hypothetical protein
MGELVAGSWGRWVSNSERALVRLVSLEMVKRAERLLNRLIFQFYETETSHDDVAPFVRIRNIGRTRCGHATGAQIIVPLFPFAFFNLGGQPTNVEGGDGNGGSCALQTLWRWWLSQRNMRRATTMECGWLVLWKKWKEE